MTVVQQTASALVRSFATHVLCSIRLPTAVSYCLSCSQRWWTAFLTAGTVVVLSPLECSDPCYLKITSVECSLVFGFSRSKCVECVNMMRYQVKKNSKLNKNPKAAAMPV